MSKQLLSAGSVVNSTSGVQPESGGVIPTPALQFSVVEISRKEASPFILEIHYAKRFPPHTHLFGLREGNELVGVVSYGPPASPQVQRSLGPVPMIELNRLVITTPTKNAASFLVGRSIRFLPAPLVVVSYADGAQGHVGYIYQATNFLYTGSKKAHDSYYIVDGKPVHPRSLASRGITAPARWAKENGILTIPPQDKHRYIFLRGNSKQIEELKRGIRWETFPYPKGRSERYDAPNFRKPNE